MEGNKPPNRWIFHRGSVKPPTSGGVRGYGFMEVNKPSNRRIYRGSVKPPAGGGVRGYGNNTASSRGYSNTCTTVNTIEVLIRMRPLNNMEISTHGYNRCLKQESTQRVTFLGHPETRFTFDHVACETIDQETLFRMAGLPMVENCLSDRNWKDTHNAW